ncbi:MAG: hydroxymethylbilane synthase [Hyphomicrobiaceae bacterium]|nr:hydroxymethylbilane synthase [Hyphomicrobiaceae bacterium]
MQSRALKIGTRGSPLALWQAEEVRSKLAAAHELEIAEIEICTFKTSGDRIQDKALREFGGKGLFTKEIEEALLAGDIDMAVHSFKDMPTVLPDGLDIACVLPREDVRDAFLSPTSSTFRELPEGAVVGTSSLRRQAQIRRVRPDLKVIEFRGNVETRLRKLDEGQADATLLAVAGLKRLGKADHITERLAPEEMLPAVAQGAICVETRADDAKARDLLGRVHDPETALCVGVERAFLSELDGSCRTPIAGLATIEGTELHFRGEILTPDGTTCHRTERRGVAGDGADAMGVDAARELLSKAGEGFFEVLE